MSRDIPTFITNPGYRPQSEDTSLEADALTFWLLKQRTTQQRLEMGISLNRSAKQFSINCFRKRFPHLSHLEFTQTLAYAWLQENYPMGYIPQGTEMTWIQDSIGLATQLHPILAGLNIPYYITGGVAAIAYGEPRTTQDLDIVLSTSPENIGILASELENVGFYVPGVEDVITGRLQTLQITHIPSISRADLVIAGKDDFTQSQFKRRQQYEVSGGVEVYLASPEDVILNKLRWGKRSQSEKQWRDVLGILKVQGNNLDFSYLNEWAEKLQLKVELEQAQIEAGLRR